MLDFYLYQTCELRCLLLAVELQFISQQNFEYSASNTTTATLNNESSLHLFVTNVPTW